MKRMKKYFGSILALAIACLTAGSIANASDTMTTEVQIAIESSDVAGADSGTSDNKIRKTDEVQGTEHLQSVQTGDAKSVWRYIVALGAATLVVIASLVRKKQKGLIAVAVLCMALFGMSHSVHAAEPTDNVSVTIPSSISISFQRTGENSISEFAIHNSSLVPISIDKVKVTECNEWKLCDKSETIPVNTRQMAFVLEGQCLQAGENKLELVVKENSSRNCDIQIGRGAWTMNGALETAMQMEFEYRIGQKEFQLKFDLNGGTQTIASQMVRNGDVTTLPTAEREGYEFAGWEDSNGNLYTGEYVMPIGDVTLTARWKQQTAYAIYIAEDQSLRFIQSADAVAPGSLYKGMTVTDVFTGFDTATYSDYKKVPWWDGSWYRERIIKKVIVEDVIQPVNIAYWFYYFKEIEYMDIRKLDTSKVTDMSSTFYMFALKSPEHMTLLGIDTLNTSNVTNMKETFFEAGRSATKFVVDLSKWDVSKVTNMFRMFYNAGNESTTFGLGDLSGWNTSNVTTMYEMFITAGEHANWYLDCSKWNVSKVTSHPYFNDGVQSKVIAPRWVY